MKTKSSFISILFLVICIFGLIAAAPTRATDYFVDVVNGDNANDGQLSTSAWKTIEYAVSQLADNDHLNVAPGTYVPVYTSGNGAVDVTQNGVTIQGAPGVVIDGGGSDGPCWGTGFYISGSDVVLRNLDITRFTCEGTKAVRVQSGSNNRIESCIISNSDDGIVFETGSGTGNVVEDCTIFETSTGVDIQDASPQILRNTIYDNSTGINIDESSGQTIQPTIANNLIFNPGTGTVMNYGIYIRAFSTGSKIAALIYHNTLNGGLSDGINISQEEPPVTFDIKYNSITNFGGYGIQDAGLNPSNPVLDYNNIYNPTGTGNYSNVAAGTNDISSDPLFLGASDLHLQPASPCVNAIPGSSGDTITEDREGTNRPQEAEYDMGCYERTADPADTLFPVQSIISTTADLAFSVYATDIDNDGDMDVLSASDGDNTVAWYENTDGNGAFGSPNNISTTTTGARSVFAADIDNDGNVDVLSASWGPNDSGGNTGREIAWYKNTGSGSFAMPSVINTYTDNISVFAADLDSDTDMDVISASYEAGYGTVAWHENNGSGTTWTEHVILAVPSSDPVWGAWDVYAADIDNDGDKDVLSASNWNNDVAWYENRLNEGTNDFGPQQIISQSADGARVVRAADMDNDGDMDVISASWFDGIVAWYENLGGGNFGNASANQNIITEFVNHHTQAVHVADLDNDGDVDVVCASWRNDSLPVGDHRIYWMENLDGLGLSWSKHELSGIIRGCQSLYTADIDGDGDLDLLSASQDDDKIAWYENKGSITNTAPLPPPIDGPADEETFDDLDTITLEGGTYSDPESHRHEETHFQIKRADSGELVLDETISGGVTSYEISPGMFPSGLKYSWRVGYVDQLGLVGWSDWYAFKIGTPETETLPKIGAGKDLGDFGMVSIVHWPKDPSPEKIFNIRYDPRYYRIGTYDAVTGGYIEFDEDLEIEPGRSYWILAREGLTVNFEGIPVSLDAEVYVALDYASGNGWNMVAPPNNADYYWGDVMVVVDDGQGLQIIDAIQYLADDTYIDRKLWRWENGGYKSDTPDTDPSHVMAAYNGYWVKANQAGVYLKFAPGMRVESVESSTTLVAKAWTKAKSWLVNLNIFSNEAVALDDDTPPMPMGGLDENRVDPVFQGCFIEIAGDVNAF